MIIFEQYLSNPTIEVPRRKTKGRKRPASREKLHHHRYEVNKRVSCCRWRSTWSKFDVSPANRPENCSLTGVLPTGSAEPLRSNRRTRRRKIIVYTRAAKSTIMSVVDSMTAECILIHPNPWSLFMCVIRPDLIMIKVFRVEDLNIDKVLKSMNLEWKRDWLCTAIRFHRHFPFYLILYKKIVLNRNTYFCLYRK